MSTTLERPTITVLDQPCCTPPGMPTVPFFILSGVAGTTAWSLIKTKKAKETEKVREAQIVRRAAEPPKALSTDLQLPIAVPVIIETSFSLTPYLDVGQRGDRFMNELLPQMRYWLFQDLGLVLPGVRIRGDAAQLQDGQYAIYVHEVPVTVGEAAW